MYGSHLFIHCFTGNGNPKKRTKKEPDKTDNLFGYFRFARLLMIPVKYSTIDKLLNDGAIIGVHARFNAYAATLSVLSFIISYSSATLATGV